MKTYPEIRVWHNNCPDEPSGENYWKHGEPEVCPDIDGYIFVLKQYDLWRESLERYRDVAGVGFLGFLPKWDRFVYRGWYHEIETFKGILDRDGIPYASFRPNFAKDIRIEFHLLIEKLRESFKLPLREFEIPTKKLWRNGDATPLNDYLIDEDQE